jgi:DNA-damage-inducible protein J
MREGLPFDIVIPTSATKRLFEVTDSGRDLIICKDAEDMLAKLEIQC